MARGKSSVKRQDKHEAFGLLNILNLLGTRQPMGTNYKRNIEEERERERKREEKWERE